MVVDPVADVNSIDTLFDYTRQLSIAEPVAIVEPVA